MERERDLRVSVRIHFQVALCDMVTANLAEVLVGWNEKSIVGHMYYFEPPSAEEIEIASDVEGEIMAAFPDHKVEITAIAKGGVESFSSDLQVACVFARKKTCHDS